ncbi:hypothetical protein N7530_000013 [Penicillium desertorum]|uniref:Nitroreductase domain-containing protein n=1 Tax=Penicillium desertorum TaxID=1303715 RepID=A0A9X0BUY6_9EURO|nr:hypothetical protein N7530_000013 [Penicillium desertorum]
MADTYLCFIRQRRTFYSLTNTSPVSDERIVEVVQEVVRHSPSSFNAQTSRVVILLGEEHLKLWTIALEVLKSTFPAQSWDGYEKKLNDRKAAYGTILLYEDQAVLPSLQVKAPLFKNHVSQFSEHNSAILAGNLWTALELDGFGANLQHFNPYIDARVAVEWALPSQWTLKAQLVFGTAVEGPNPDKKYGNLEERILVFGKQ